MVRLIDAEELTDELIKGIEADTNKSIQTPFAKGVGLLLCKALELQPTVDAVPVLHGKWIKDRLVSTGGGTYGVRRCSACDWWCNDSPYEFKYCPHCGARMDADE